MTAENTMASSILQPTLQLRTSNINLKSSSSSSSQPSFDPAVAASTATTPLLPLVSSSTTIPTFVSTVGVKNTHTDAGSVRALISSHTCAADAIGVHRGAIDNTTITSGPPTEVMAKARDVLDAIGICVQPESTFRFRCIRPASGAETLPDGIDLVPRASEAQVNTNTIYANDPSRDPAGEVRFSVELTRLAGLNDTYSLDIRRLKGNLRSYQFLYETIRDRAQLTT